MQNRSELSFLRTSTTLLVQGLAAGSIDNAVCLHFVNLLVNNVQILEWVSPESFSERAVSSCINAILNIRCRLTNYELLR